MLLLVAPLSVGRSMQRTGDDDDDDADDDDGNDDDNNDDDNNDDDNLDDDNNDDDDDGDPADYTRQTGTGSRFTTASAFPRLVFATSGNNDDHDDFDHDDDNTFYVIVDWSFHKFRQSNTVHF